MKNNKERISELLNGMKKESNKVNRITVTVDTNDADYNTTETIITEKDELIQLERAVLLATLCEGSYGLEEFFDNEESTVLRDISESEEEFKNYQSLIDDLLGENIDVREGHSLEKVEVYYDEVLYEVMAEEDEVIREILNRWDSVYK